MRVSTLHNLIAQVVTYGVKFVINSAVRTQNAFCSLNLQFVPQAPFPFGSINFFFNYSKVYTQIKKVIIIYLT